MKKIFQLTSALLILVGFFGCKKDIELKPVVGSIHGIVQFDNVSNHEGINVVLESTDGLMALSYYSARGIESNVRSVESSVKTDENGSFYFDNVPVGVYTVTAFSDLSHKKAILTNVIVEKSRVTELEVIKLKATGNIKGSVTIDNTKDNVFGIDILVLGTSYSAVTDEEGKYEISDVPVKNEGYSLALRKDGYTYIFQRNVTVNPGDSIDIKNIDVKSSELNSNSLIWKGFSAEEPKNPKLNWAYFNTTDRCLYIFDGESWVLLVQDGKDGLDGVSIVWKGEFEIAPEKPELYWAYFNTTDGCSYIWNGEKWDKLSQAGKDGEKGEQGNPGEDGKDGLDGVNGLSIVWKGEFEIAPEKPELYWAYFNTTDGCSYIWNGEKWNKLSQAGKDGEGHAHTFGEWEIIREENEFVDGVRRHECLSCKAIFEEVIPKLPIPVVNPEPYGTRVDNLNHIFNNQTLGTTTITMKRSEWNQLCDNYRFFYKNENYVHALQYKYEKDGETWAIPNVAFRQRGNTSRFCPQGVDNGRLQGQQNADWSADYYTYAEQPNDDYRQVHFKVDFEEFLEGDEELKMAGCMKGVALKRLDHSWGREIFCYDLFHRYGIWTAPRASHTRVILKFIEDETDNSITTVDYGVYEMFEEVNKQSLKARAQEEGETASNLWANNKGNLWKCSNDLTTGRMHETGVEDIRIIFDENGNPIDKIWNGYSLDLKTNKDKLASAEAELHGFIKGLNALPTDENDESIATIKAFYEKWFDMDFFLKTYAINILLGMDDDYWGNGNNFYLYFDTGKNGTGKLYFIPFDYDNTLGCSIHEGGFKQNPLEWGRGKNRPLMDRMLLVPEFKQKFIDLLYEVSDENSYWNFERCSQQFLYWKTMLEPYAASPDLHDKISQKYWGDYTWQPGEYSLTNYSNNIYDATRKYITGKGLKISEIDSSEGVKVSVNYVPENVSVRRLYIDGKFASEAKEGWYQDVVYNEEFFYPYVTAGKEYSVYVEYLDSDYKLVERSNTIKIIPDGGLGNWYISNLNEIWYNYEDNILSISPLPVIKDDCENIINPHYYFFEFTQINGNNYIGWNPVFSTDGQISLNLQTVVNSEMYNCDIMYKLGARYQIYVKDEYELDKLTEEYEFIIKDYDNTKPLRITE